MVCARRCICSATAGSRSGCSANAVLPNGDCQPLAVAASMNHWAYGSRNSGQSERVSAARAIATPSAVAPTLSVMSQSSSSVLAIFHHLVLGQQVVAVTLLTVGQLANPIGHDRCGDESE